MTTFFTQKYVHKTCRVHREQIWGVTIMRCVLHIPNSTCTLQTWHVQEKLHSIHNHTAEGTVPPEPAERLVPWNPTHNHRKSQCTTAVSEESDLLEFSNIQKLPKPPYSTFYCQKGNTSRKLESRTHTYVYPSCVASKGKMRMEKLTQYCDLDVFLHP